MDAPELMKPFTIKDVTIRNRIAISPMAMYMAEDGVANDWHLVHLGKYAIGGCGLIVSEATAVESRAGTSPYDVGLWNDGQIEPLRHLTSFIRKQGSTSAVQLAHAGRKANLPPPWVEPHGALFTDRLGDPIAPSSIKYLPDAPPPKEMTLADIEDVKRAWGDAARRALAAGFDIVEIHGAHGYLIHEFLSKQTNKRTDTYGGPLENRMRLGLEIAEVVRAAWPAEKPLFFRMSVMDLRDDAWPIEDAIRFANELKSRGVDLIDCSANGITGRATTTVGKRDQGWLVHLSRHIREGARMPTMTVGLITEPQFANEVVLRGEADLVAIGREALFNPHWALQASLAIEPDQEFGRWPPQYAWWLGKRAEAQRAQTAAARESATA